MKIIYQKYKDFDKSCIKEIDDICFGDVPKEDVIYDFIDNPIGMFLLLNNGKIIGRVGIHKRVAFYNNQEYVLCGLGGLAVLPEYRNKGYGSKLIRCAINKMLELKCDVACMCVDRSKKAYKLYEKFGYVFLNRDAYYIDALERKKRDDSVMILGICNKDLADYILNSNFEFNYGTDKGYW
ncbi:MAG TPA: GNAT family N-acetyltransferase [Bacilli bacterium]|nr:GNAT family N-acetyltransferase [Bacilli bacterium]